MRLKEALSVLSKASPFAVSTDGKTETELSAYKDYLYVEGEIEEAFCAELERSLSTPDKIIFLCGSSGDGKSEILTRHSERYKNDINFHLDGTHSYAPDETAIQALNTRFTDHKSSAKPLVVGINIGMLGNYAEEGAEAHQDIKDSIRLFLSDEPISKICKEHCFLYFEHYSKFTFDSGVADSVFARNIMERITIERDDNPFFPLYKQELADEGTSYLASNFAMLSRKEIQDTIVEILLKTRLAKDQFLTARTLLDFLHQLLCSNGYLFDTLFCGGDNELLGKIQIFDPVVARSDELDSFIIQSSMKLAGKEFDEFISSLNELHINTLNDVHSQLRLFYLLKRLQIGNNFHQKFFDVLKEETVSNYIEYWEKHHDYFYDKASRGELLYFYKRILIKGIHSYINRKTPWLSQKEWAVSRLNGFIVVAELDIKGDFRRLANDSVPKKTHFNAYLTANDVELEPIPISLNLLELLLKVQNGYQPSKHDSTSILLLDEISEQILSVARAQNKISFVRKNKRYTLNNVDNEYIEVEGI